MAASTYRAGVPHGKIALAHVLVGVALVALFAGVALRFSNLATKTFWGDETYTLLRVSGYTQQNLDRLMDGKVHGIGALREFQRVQPANGIVATANSLAVDEPQHPPLFFVAERLWMGAFGNSVVAARIISAIASALAILGMWWLGRELFGTVAAAWIAVALFSLSPFQIAYAHDAREYSAWTAFTLLATAALLRAARTNAWQRWAAYAVFAVLGLYTDLLFVYVVIANGFMLVCVRSTRTRQTLGAYCVAAGVAVAAFSPWLVTVYQHRGVLANDMDWATNAMPLSVYFAKLLFNASTVFFDLTFADMRFAPVSMLVLAIAAVAMFVTIRNAPANVRAVVVCLAATALPFFGGDLLHHTYFATGSRYFVPVWIALGLSVAYACGVSRGRAWRAAYAFLLVCGAVSGIVGVRSAVWWDNHDDAASQGMAQTVNAAPAPPLVMVKPNNMPRLLVLSRYVRDDTRFEVVAPQLDGGHVATAASLFVLTPDTFMRGAVRRETGCALRPAEPDSADSAVADRLHASLARFRGKDVDALWIPADGAGCRAAKVRRVSR